MLQKLIQVGDQKAIILDQTLLDHLKLDNRDSVEIAIQEAGVLVTAPSSSASPESFEQAKHHVLDKHAETLKRLA